MTVLINGNTGISGTNGSAGTPAVQGEDTNTGIFFPAADTVAVATGGAERVRVDSSGNVGVGTASPSGASGRVLEINGGAGQARLVLKNDTTGSTSSDGSQIALVGSQLVIQNRENSEITFETNLTERMRIDASGNLGLGVTPSAWTTFTAMQFGETGCLASNAFSSSNTQTFFGNNVYYDGAYKYIATGSAATQYLQLGSEHRWNIAPSGTAGNAITFTQAMTLDASGNLLVGTTTASGALSVSPTSATYTGFFAGTAGGYNIACRGGTTTGTSVRILNGSGTEVGTITYTATATQYVTSSDYRLKENVAPMQNALDTVAQLNPVTYTWKADGSAGQGFIAHELQAVVPDCVTGEKDAVDETGNPQYQGVDTSFLVATLVKAIQELTARVAQLEAQ